MATASTECARSGVDQCSENVLEPAGPLQVRALVSHRAAALVGEAVALIELPCGDVRDVGLQADCLAALLAGDLLHGDPVETEPLQRRTHQQTVPRQQPIGQSSEIAAITC